MRSCHLNKTCPETVTKPKDARILSKRFKSIRLLKTVGVMILLTVALTLTGCGMKRPQRPIGYLEIPDSVINPKLWKVDHGVYDCESNLYKCVTYRDWSAMSHNINEIKKTKQQILNIIQIHNEMVERMERTMLPSELNCGPMDFACKKKKNELLNR